MNLERWRAVRRQYPPTLMAGDDEAEGTYVAGD
jgi:hypothetical protein